MRPHGAAGADAGVRSPPLQVINCPVPSPSPSPAPWPPSPSELARCVFPSCRLPGPLPWPCRLPLLWACRVPRGLGLAGLRESRQAGALPTEAPRVPHVGSREPASRPGRSFPPARLMPGAPRARATPGRPPLAALPICELLLSNEHVSDARGGPHGGAASGTAQANPAPARPAVGRAGNGGWVREASFLKSVRCSTLVSKSHRSI